MILRQLFDLLSQTWNIHLISESDRSDFIDFSDSRRFDPYLDREIDSAEKSPSTLPWPYAHVVLKARDSENAIGKLLKELMKRNFEISWRYEDAMNAVIVRIRKKYNSQWYSAERALSFWHFHTMGLDMFDPRCMCPILKEMAQKIDHEAGKGEHHD